MANKINEQDSGKRVEDLQAIRIEDYTYDLPEERVAKYPLTAVK